jgi:hypothetical protein
VQQRLEQRVAFVAPSSSNGNNKTRESSLNGNSLRAVQQSPSGSINVSSSAQAYCSTGGTQQRKQSLWALSAIEADASGLPARTDRVLICLISSGIIASSPFLSHNTLGGCSREDRLDPGGCILPWDSPADNKGNWKRRGTQLAAIMAATGSADPRIRGVISEKAELYVVPVNLANGAVEPGANSTGGTSRLRAYSACEGRLRGLQAQDYGLIPPAPSKWRMVMLVDVDQAKPTSEVGGDFPTSEAAWFAAATQQSQGAPDDILVVAPAGDDRNQLQVAFPAAIKQVMAVAAYGCNLTALKGYESKERKPDILAPGLSIAVPSAKKLSAGEMAKSKDVMPESSELLSHAAAAYVAAAAARLWNAHPGCSASSIRRALTNATVAFKQAQPPLLNLKKANEHLQVFQCSDELQ